MFYVSILGPCGQICGECVQTAACAHGVLAVPEQHLLKTASFLAATTG